VLREVRLLVGDQLPDLLLEWPAGASAPAPVVAGVPLVRLDIAAGLADQQVDADGGRRSASASRTATRRLP